ncbi:Alkaline ceramidase 3 [Metarhizium anisopliae]
MLKLTSSLWTITNGLFLWLGAVGVRNCYRESHPTIFLIAYLGYIIVGLGSVSFHATLKYPVQLVDELGMIYTTCLMIYASFAVSRSRVFAVKLGVGLTTLAVFITLYYHATKDPAFHQAAYAVLTATVLIRSIWVMEVQVRPSLQAEDAARARYILKTMWALVATGEIRGFHPTPGLTVFLTGYAIWNLDNIFCSQLRGWRRQIGLPWAILLEGHGWWHLMTGLGMVTRLFGFLYKYDVGKAG